MFSDNITWNFLAHFTLSFLLCSASIIILSYFANSRNLLLDNPTERKQHVGSIPLVGGLAFFITYTVYFVFYGSYGSLPSLYLAALWLMLVGLADDHKQLSSGFRLIAQIAAALVLVYFGDTQITSVGKLFGGTDVRFERASLIFTVMCVLGVINAINMIDGIDGLSSGIAILTLFSLFVVSLSSVGVELPLLIIVLMGSLLAFFLFNTGYFGISRKVFMGDSGSTVLGFILAWLFITLSQDGAKPLSPVVAGWIFGVPLMDSVSVMVRRLSHGKSPFKADRNHMHHRIMDRGYSPRTTLLILLSIHAVMQCIGILFNGVASAEPYLFWSFIALVLLRHCVFELRHKLLA